MDSVKFIAEFRKALEIDPGRQIDENTILQDLEEYDSLAILSIIAMADEKFGKKISGAEFPKLKIIGDLIKLIG